ncbi:MAG: transcription antitermination factor NusB [Gemmatimonadota bacterium]
MSPRYGPPGGDYLDPAEDQDESSDSSTGSVSRAAAFQILVDVSRGARADEAAERRLANLPKRARALAMELAFGSIRFRARLDAELSELVDRPLRHVDDRAKSWLRIGLYQLRETRIPDHAAVHATVEAVRSSGRPRVAGFVNAVLRNATRRGERSTYFPAWEFDPLGYLSTYGSHPRWLVERWMARWPLADVRALVENDNRPAPVVLRMLEPDASEEPAEGLRPVTSFAGSYIYESGDPTGVLSRMRAVVQDPAASAVVDYIGPDIEGPVYEVCAAPGGKTLASQALAPEARPWISADVNKSRLERLSVGRPAAHNTGNLAVMDGRAPAVRKVSTVLLDTPCTGTGVLRRRVDARWRLTSKDLVSLVGLQAQLLSAGADRVAPGGLLVYSTCSLEPEENEMQVNRFLKESPDFQRDAPPAGVSETLLTESGDLLVLPWERGTDGSYAARLRKEG